MVTNAVASVDSEVRVATQLQGTGRASTFNQKCAIGLCLTAVIGAGVLALVLLPLIDWLIAILKWVEKLGLWAPVFVVGMYTVGAVVTAPGTPMHFGCGALFGIGWGLAINVCGYMIGSSCGFLLGRYLLQVRVRRVSLPLSFPASFYRCCNGTLTKKFAVCCQAETVAFVASDSEQSTGPHGLLVPA